MRDWLGQTPISFGDYLDWLYGSGHRSEKNRGMFGGVANPRNGGTPSRSKFTINGAKARSAFKKW